MCSTTIGHYGSKGKLQGSCDLSNKHKDSIKRFCTYSKEKASRECFLTHSNAVVLYDYNESQIYNFIFQLFQLSTVVSSEDKQGESEKFQTVWDNSTYMPEVASSLAKIDGVAAWDEWVGVVDRNEDYKTDHLDVMRCLQPDLESLELYTTSTWCVAEDVNPTAMLELE
ncbi:hypothetical protein V6N13_097562 [Hibiscus sabdariffa]|uniref:Uncharacterized protein n=2 Tax=Hibiscus sabdariffa TaxID=183260 RepID=A0ABR2B2A9_9ROSI